MGPRLTRAAVCLLPLASVPALTSCAALFGSKIANVSAVSEPPGAEVFLDGNRLGTTPVQVRLAHKRSHTLVFKRAGYRDATCYLQSTTQAGWVILDVLFGLVPVIIDAATGDWNQISDKNCTVVLPADYPGATVATGTPPPAVTPAPTPPPASQPAPPSTGVTPATIPPFRFQSSAPDELVPETTRAARRVVVGDLLRLGIVSAVVQGPPGILRTAIGETFHTSSSRERHYSSLALQYHTWRAEGAPLVIELWEQGQKIGEFTDGAFLIGQRYSTPLDCMEPGPGGICGYGPASREVVPPAAPVLPATPDDKPPPRASPLPVGGSSQNIAPVADPAMGHRGFHFNFGLGAGAADLVCDGCDFASQSALSGYLALGGSIGEKTVLGVESTGWVHENESGFDAQVYSLMATLIGYLNAESGLFLTSGIGLVGYKEDSGVGELLASGFGFSGRLGYQLRTGGGRLTLTPYLAFISTIGGANFEFDDTEVGEFDINNLQFGLALGVN